MQAAANALRLVIWSGLESSVLALQKSLQADSTMIKGPEEGVIVEILSRLHAIRGHCSSDNINDSSDSDFVAYLLASLPKDNAFLTQCVTTQTDTFGVLTNFETKIVRLTLFFFRNKVTVKLTICVLSFIEYSNCMDRDTRCLDH